MNDYTVYCHISPSNKRYFGITSMNVKKRWGKNGNGYKEQVFYRAIKKYGWDNFEHIIVAKGLSKEEAEWLEIELIKEWDTRNPNKGYNCTDGGEGVKGYNPPKELRQLWSKQRSGENNPFYNKNPRNHMSEKILKEHDRKLSERWLGENNPNYGVHRYGEESPHWNKPHSEKTKRKLGKPVICLTTKRIFYTAREGAKYYNIKSYAHITSCCNGDRKSCGTYNGQKLIWRKLNYKHNKIYRISDNSILKRVK